MQETVGAAEETEEGLVPAGDDVYIAAMRFSWGGTPVPERITLVDHALTRMAHRGMVSYIDVEGDERPEIYDPNPGDEPAEDGTQHQHSYNAVGGTPPMMDAVVNRLFEQTLRWPRIDEVRDAYANVLPITGDGGDGTEDTE